jgi:protoporphyrinogen oxidase
MSEFNLVIVGSSPMSLVEAAFRAEQGKKVCILEASDRIGGAWATIDCLGLKNIEASPHVFMPDQTALNVLKRFLPYDYEELEVQPRLLIRNSKIFGDMTYIEMRQRYREALILTTINRLENGKGNLFARGWDTFSYANYLMGYRRKHRQTHPLIYPKGGLQKWLDACKQHLLELGVEFRKETKLDEIRLNGEDLTLVDDSGNIISTDQLCYSDQMIAAKLTIDGANIPISYQDDTSDHVVFIVEGAFPQKPLGFVRLLRDSYLMFINDITEYSAEFQTNHPGKRLINVRISAYRTFMPSAVDTFFSHISFVGYMSKEFKFTDYHHTYYHRRKLTYEMRSRLKKLLKHKAYELVSGTVGLANGLRDTYGKELKVHQNRK